MRLPRSPLVFSALAAALSACIFVSTGCIIVDGEHRGFVWDDWGDGDKVQGSGHRMDEERTVNDFSSVQLQLPADVLVVVGEPTSITLSGDDNLLALIETDVENGRLVIDRQRGKNPRFRKGLDIRIGTPDLSRFEVEGSGDVEIRNLSSDNFHVAIEGSGDVVASGTTDYLEARIEGSGDMKLERLAAQEATVSISGSGDIRVNVASSLRYKISGSGDIRYDGSPHVSGGISGSGSVRGR